MAFSPTPPQPITSTVEPASILAWRVTAPTPVATQQPTSAACGQGMSLRIGTSISDGTTTCSLNVPMRAIWLTPVAPCDSRKVPSNNADGGEFSRPMHSTVRPAVQ